MIFHLRATNVTRGHLGRILENGAMLGEMSPTESWFSKERENWALRSKEDSQSGEGSWRSAFVQQGCAVWRGELGSRCRMGVRKWARGDLLLLPGVEPGRWRFLQRRGDLDVKSFLLSWGGESLSVAGTHAHQHVLGIR